MSRRACVLSVLLLLSFSSPASALELAPIGSRAQGMGGAFVAVANDATAVYWNPAGLSAFRGWEVQGLASIHGQDHMDVFNVLDEVEDVLAGRQISDVVGDPSSIDRLVNLLEQLGKPGKGVDLNVAAGLIIKGSWGDHAFAVSGLPLFQAGATMSIDTTRVANAAPVNPDSIANNESSALLNGLEGRQYIFSYSHALFGDKLFGGVNLKLIDGVTYHYNLAVLQPDIDISWDNLRRSRKRSQEFSIDAGLIAVPFDWLRLGVVGRDLTGPSFTSSRGEEIELEPQFRAGIALLPLPTLTLAVDVDLSENDSFTRGYRERTVAVGLEKTFLSELLSLRLGGYKNVAEDDSNYVATAGLGLRVLFLGFDVGGGYDFQAQEVLGSASLSACF
jgi:hypothetical protein